MTKTKQWKITLIALCAVLVLSLLATALLLGVDRHSKAKADESVLSGNTAEYTIESDGANPFLYTTDGNVSYTTHSGAGNDILRTYSWDSNTWYSMYGEIVTEAALSKMTLDVTQDGSISFEYKTTATNFLETYYFRVWKNDETSAYILNICPINDTSLKEYQTLTIDSLHVGDKIHFEVNFMATNHILIHGLKKPSVAYTVSASVAEDSANGGTVSANDGESSTTASASVEAGQGVKLKATPTDGYVFSYWTNDAGEIVSYKAEYEIAAVQADANFAAHFLKKDETRTTSSSGGEGEYWTTIGDGKYTLDTNVYVKREYATLNFDFYIEKDSYLKFDYKFSGSGTLTMKYGDVSTPVSGTNDTLFQVNKNAETTSKYVRLFSAGFHHIELTFRLNTGRLGEVSIENLGVCSYEELDKTTVTFDIPECFNVKMSHDGLAEPKALTHDDATVTVPTGLAGITFTAEKTDEQKASAIAPDVQVDYAFGGFASSTIDDGAWTTNTNFSLIVYNGSTVGIIADGQSATTAPTVYTFGDSLSFGVKYTENAPKFEVSAIKVSGYEQEEIKSIAQGDSIKFKFQEVNTLTIRIKKFLGIENKDISLLIDGVEKNAQLQNQDEMFICVIDVDGMADVSISYLKADDAVLYSQAKLSFQCLEEPETESTLEDILHLGDDLGGANLTVTQKTHDLNDWIFDPVLSEEGNYAYRTSYAPRASKDTWAYQNGASELAFTLSGTEETVCLSFQFQLDGWYFEDSTYDVGKNVGQLSYSYTHPGQFDKGPESYGPIVAQPDASGIQYGDGVVDLGNGWHQVNIIMQPNTTTYVIFWIYQWGTAKEYHTCWASIRDVQLSVGDKQVDVSVSKEADSGSKVTAAVQAVENGNSYEITKDNGQNITVTTGSIVKFTAQKSGSDIFYGWTVNGNLVSREEEFVTSFLADSKVVAWFAPAGTYHARREGTFFETLTEAMNGATNGQTVYILTDETISGELTIPAGVTLRIPYNVEGDFTANGDDSNAANRISWFNETYKKAYLTVTIDANAKITIYGRFELGGVVNVHGQGYQGHTSGAYSQIIHKGNIVVEDGGIFDVYGRVTGEGTIDVNYGGKLYQPFLILDFAGGTNAFDSYMAGVTPFKRYAMINIESQITVNYGGQVFGHTTLWALEQYTTINQPFISYDMGDGKGGDGRGNETFVMLHSGASVVVTYDPSKMVDGSNVSNCTEGIGLTKMVFSGGADFSYMLFSALGASVPTFTVSFAIPYNFEVELNDFAAPQGNVHAQYQTKTDFMIMPGAKVTLGEGATLTLNSDLWILDGYEGGNQAGKSYPTAEQLKTAGYSQSGNLIVNGTLKLGKKKDYGNLSLGDLLGGGLGSGGSTGSGKEIGVTLLGIIQTGGATGKLEIAEDAVLNGTIIDGIEGQNYFASTSSARVFDAAHGKEGVIAELQAGHTYTATGSGEFTLESLKYTNTKDGEEKLTLDLNQQLHGSWMVDHSDAHKFDWTPVGTDAKPDDATKRQTLTRQCTELGCNETAHKELLYVPSSFGDIEYKAQDVTEADLQGLLDKLYSEGIEATFSDFNGARGVNNYTVTVKLSNAFWYDNEQYVDSKQLTFNVKAKAITVTAQDQSSTYGETYNISQEAFDAPELCVGDQLNLTIKVKGDVDTKNVGTYTLEIVLGSNPNYTITPVEGHYTVNQLNLKVTVPSFERNYNGKVPQVEDITNKLSADKPTGYQDKLEDIVTFEIVNANKDVATYVVKGTQTEQSKTNYKVEITDGSYVINKVTVQVKANDLSSVYGQELKQLTFTVTGLVGDENINDYIKISTNATDTSPVGSNYVITVEWKDENRPTNYDAKFTNGTYTITIAEFEGVSFSADPVTYDGETHKPTVTGAPEEAVITYKVNDEEFNGARDVGEYKIVATVSLANYTSATFEATLRINPRAIKVNIPSKTRQYNGEVPQVSELTATLDKDSTLGKGDELSSLVTLTIENAAKDVADYTITAKAVKNDNYTITFGSNGTYSITAVNLTVKVLPQTKVYDKVDGSIASSEENWEITDGNRVGNDDLQITLTLERKSGNNSDVGSYNIKGTCNNKNYKVTFTDETGAYTITARTLTVTANDQHTEYGAQPVALTGTDKYTVDGWLEDLTLSVTLTCQVTANSPVTADGYTITVKVNNSSDELRNYTLQEVNGKYTVDPKPVTVKIADQNSVFGYKKAYALDNTLWTVEGSLANNEGKDVLQVTLSIPTITTAGSYAITGSYQNNNYTVTFEGSYEGTKGTFTVAKKTVEDNVDDTTFQALVNGEQWQADENYKLADGSLTFSCLVYVYEGEEPKQLKVTYTCNDKNKVSELSFNKEGVYEITVEIDDVNYQGSATYSLEIVGADGRTQHLKDVLDALKERAGELTPETLTTTNECFETLNFIKQKVDSLSEDEQAMAEEDLAPYLELVEAWNNAVDEDVIVTAQAIAQAPINGLMVIASLNAIVMAVYVIGKGGLLR